MSAENKKTVRQQLSKVTQTVISPARIRSFLDVRGINKEVEDRLTSVKEEILRIKKEGGPQKPVAPEPLKKESTDLQKEAHAKARAKYEEELKKYSDFTSERYKRLEVVYTLCKHLNKVHAHLMREKRNTNQEKELVELRRLISDQPATRKKGESDETYNTRVAEFTSAGYTDLVGNTDLSNADAVQTLINKLKQQYEGVSLFLQRDETSRSRVRFNDPAAVALATAMELGIEEMVEHGMEKTLESGKKTLQPDHCVSSGLENLQWFVLFRNLPHLRAILERQKRKAEYNTERDKEKQKLVQKAKSKAKKDKKAYVRPKFTYPTFQQQEVVKGFAKKTVTTDDQGHEKPHFEWYGIDLEAPNTPAPLDDTNFHFYVSQVCKKVIQRRSDIGNSDFLDIKISTNIRKFCSDLIVDFIARISPLIRILIKAMNVKTVDHDVIKNILELILVDSYHSATGVVKLNEDHQRLFDLIDEKVNLCQAHQTGQVTKTDAVAQDDEEDDVDDEEEAEETTQSDKVGHSEDPTADVVKESTDDTEDDVDEVQEEAPKPAARKIGGNLRSAVRKQ